MMSNATPPDEPTPEAALPAIDEPDERVPGGNPPLQLEAWLRAGASPTLPLPVVRHASPPKRSEVANLALCLIAATVFAVAAAVWITNAPPDATTKTDCV